MPSMKLKKTSQGVKSAPPGILGYKSKDMKSYLIIHPRGVSVTEQLSGQFSTRYEAFQAKFEGCTISGHLIVTHVYLNIDNMY